MKGSIFEQVTSALRARYGSAAQTGERYRWSTLLDVALGGRKKPQGGTRGRESVLDSAAEVAALSVSRVSEALEESGWSGRHGKAIWGLARWWLKDAAREAEEPAAWDRPVESLRDELRSVPGVNATLADRILLHVGGMAAFPIDRAAIRIAGRHGWMEVSADYEEWQSFFTRGAADAGAELEALAAWFGAVGRDYCGPRPKCEACPLRDLLPASGPLALDDADPDG